MIDQARRGQIIRLLQTHDEHLPQPVRREHRPAGFVHNVEHRESCPDCLTNGRAMPGCETCGGQGHLTIVRERDPYLDPKQPVFDKSSQARRDLQRQMDAEIDRLTAQTAEPEPTEADLIAKANLQPYGWELARRRLYDRYDHGPLDRQLEQLRQHDIDAYHALHAVHIYGWAAGGGRPLERGLAFLDERLPNPLRAPADPDADVDEIAARRDSLRYGKTDRHAQARAARVDRVLRAHFEWGWSTGQIAAHESLTRRRVQQLLAEHQGEYITPALRAAVASGPAA